MDDQTRKMQTILTQTVNDKEYYVHGYYQKFDLGVCKYDADAKSAGSTHNTNPVEFTTGDMFPCGFIIDNHLFIVTSLKVYSRWFGKPNRLHSIEIISLLYQSDNENISQKYVKLQLGKTDVDAIVNIWGGDVTDSHSNECATYLLEQIRSMNGPNSARSLKLGATSIQSGSLAQEICYNNASNKLPSASDLQDMLPKDVQLKAATFEVDGLTISWSDIYNSKFQ